MLKKINASHFLGILFLLFVLSDFISKAGAFYYNSLIHTSQITKGLFQLFAVGFIVKNNHFKDRFLYVGIGLLLSFHCLGLLFLDSEFSFLNNLKSNVHIINWYLFVFLLILAFRSYERTVKLDFSKTIYFLRLCFVGYFYANLIAAITGFLIDFELFSSYPYSDRFGFNGLMRNVTHASYIVIIYIIYFYYQYKQSATKRNLFHLLSALCFVFLLATKATILFLLLFFAFIVYKKNKLFFAGLLLIMGITPFILKDFLLNQLLPKYFAPLAEVYENQGMLPMLTSLRSEQFTELFLPYVSENWGFANYLFGGFDNSLRKIEFELVDLWLTFGLLGILLYLFIFFKYAFPIVWIKKHSLVLLLFFIVFLAGSFFSSVPVITVFFVFYLLSSERLLSNILANT